jgi:ABC-type anion transport system duplicated permease subunit
MAQCHILITECHWTLAAHRANNCAMKSTTLSWADPRYLELAKTLGLSRFALIRHVILPQALQIVWGGLRSSVGTPWSAHVDARPS